MNLLKSLASAIIAIVESLTKMATKTIPNIGGTTYHITGMALDASEQARTDSLIQHTGEMKRLKKESGLTETEYKQIQKKLEY